MTRLLFLAAALLSLGFAPAPFPRAERGEAERAVKADLAALQGTWVWVIPPHLRRHFREVRLEVAGARLAFHEDGGELEAWDVTGERGPAPRRLTRKPAPGSGGEAFEATYAIAEDTLTLRYRIGKEGWTAMTFRRKKAGGTPLPKRPKQLVSRAGGDCQGS